MKLLLLVGLLAVSSPALADDRFAPGNPTFGQFEATCRHGSDMDKDCRGSVLGAFAAYAKTTPDKVKCDYAAYWAVADKKYSDKISVVLPWQTVMEFVVAEPGICKP